MCPRAALVSPTALGGLKVSSQPFLEPLLQLWRQAGGGSVTGKLELGMGDVPWQNNPWALLPHVLEVCAFGQLCDHGVIPNVCAVGRNVNKAESSRSWGWAACDPLSLLLRVRKGRGCESICVAKRINTLLLCPINLSSVGGWRYPPVLQLNGFR